MKFNINDTVNAQINTELWSAYLYLSMSTYAAQKGFNEYIEWFDNESRTKHSRAKRLISHLVSKEVEVCLYPIEEVPAKWETPLDMFKKALEYEKKISKLINTMITFAWEVKEDCTIEVLSQLSEEQEKQETKIKEMIAAIENGQETPTP